MPRHRLPAACHWAGTADSPILMFNYRVVAVITPTGPGQPLALQLMWGAHHIHAAHRGSLAKAKRYIECWVAAQRDLPGQRRANKMRARAQRMPDAALLAAFQAAMAGGYQAASRCS